MKLTRYLTRELIPPLLAGTLLFTAILSFGYFFVSSQFLKGAPGGLIAQWIAYQLPDTLVKVLPMGVVLMTVVAFGRLTAERELVAMQSGGVGLARVARPAWVIGGLVTALTLWLSLWVAPSYNVATRALYWDTLTGAGLQQLVGRTLDLGGGLSLSMRGYDHARRQLSGVRLERWRPDRTQSATVTFADTASFEDNALVLRGYSVYTLDFSQVPGLSRAAGNGAAGSGAAELQALRAAVGAVFQAVRAPGDPAATLRVSTGLSRQGTLARYADALGADAEGWSQLVTKLRAPGVPPAERAQARIDLNRKLALPFGNLVLVLAALPFALRFGRSLGVSLGIALLIAVAYYLTFVVGLTLAAALPGLPEPGVWLANLVFAVAGLLLLRRA